MYQHRRAGSLHGVAAAALVLCMLSSGAALAQDAATDAATDDDTTQVVPEAVSSQEDQPQAADDNAIASPTQVPIPQQEGAANGTAPAGPSKPGDVLLADNFDDPLAGRLPSGSQAYGSTAYVAGEYQLLRSDLTTTQGVGSKVPGTYGDSSLAVDVRAPGGFVRDDLLNLRCRLGPGSANTGYRASVLPATQQVGIDRLDGDLNNAPVLVPRRVVAQLHPDGSNHVEMTCAGSTVSLAVNGVVVASVQDGRYASGSWSIVVGGARQRAVDVRLDNLVVTQR